MEAFLLIYNVILIILYCIPLLLAFLLYQKNQKHVYLHASLLFGTFVLDELIIYMTDFIPWFSDFYKELLLSVPTLKTIIYFLSFLCMIKIIEGVMNDNFSLSLYIGLVILIVFLLFVPGVDDSSLKLWLYYTASSVFAVVIGLLGLYKYRKTPSIEHTNTQKFLRNVLTLLIFFYISITLEDSFSLFDPNSFLYRSTRSISEDIFRIVLATMTTTFLIKKLIRSLHTSDNDNDNTSALLDNAKPNTIMEHSSAASYTQTKAYSKFYLFCKEYHLTSREQDIMLLILDDKNNVEISEELIISLGTVKTHIHNIYAKLDVKKRKQLMELYEEFRTDERKDS